MIDCDRYGRDENKIMGLCDDKRDADGGGSDVSEATSPTICSRGNRNSGSRLPMFLYCVEFYDALRGKICRIIYALKICAFAREILTEHMQRSSVAIVSTLQRKSIYSPTNCITERTIRSLRS